MISTVQNPKKFMPLRWVSGSWEELKVLVEGLLALQPLAGDLRAIAVMSVSGVGVCYCRTTDCNY